MVRTQRELVEQNKVGIGWSDFNFSSLDSAELTIQKINELGSVGRRGNQIRRFFDIKEGDLVVVPLPYCIAVGEATGGMHYDKDNWYDLDKSNQLLVNFPKDVEGNIITIPRVHFTEGFQRRLRVRGITVNSLNEFAEEIRAVYEGGADQTHPWKTKIQECRDQLSKSFKESLLNNIQSGKTNLKSGGLGLETLVSELLNIDGYETYIYAKSKFKSFADADINATRVDLLSQTELLIQVKHHAGWSGDHGIKQLLEIEKQNAEDVEGKQLVFVTSALISEEAKILAERADIIMLDGNNLVEWIESSIPKLSQDTLDKLGVIQEPGIV